MKYPYVFFDWDGTLIQSIEPWIYAKQEALAEFDIMLSLHEVGESLGNLTYHVDVHGLDDHEFNEVLLAKVRPRLANLQLYDGAHDMLRTLHDQGVKLALLTTGFSDFVMHDLDRLGVKPYFDFILTGDQVNQHKPHPESIERALEHFNASPQTALMVGDTSKDLGAAIAAGVDAVLFHHPEQHGHLYDVGQLKRQFSPKYVIEDLQELTSIIGVEK